ncbi:hypothetical protein ACFP1Z_08485 [Streptomyces gamaensis]|uniref:Uncharacterized protein n=1 Tax=Streptomyces gamaensis TaxID=1763542 RepID=A0ABW0YY88_9ACTN
MPDDVGGKPFPDGEEPDSSHQQDATGPAAQQGGGKGWFAPTALDEEFVRAAPVHEPTAAERIRSAAQARAEADPARPRSAGGDPRDSCDPFGHAEGLPGHGDGFAGDRPGGTGWPSLSRDLDPDDAYGPYGRYGAPRAPYRGHPRWHRPVAWILAVLMGIGVVALAFTAVYRGASSGDRTSPDPPPATSGVDAPVVERPGPLPSVSADAEPPVGSAASRG